MKFQPMVLLKTRKDLVRALIKTDPKLPASIPRLNFFEDEGIIDLPKYGLKRGMNGYDRLYSEKEIEVAVASIIEYAKNKPRFGTKV